MRCEDVRRAATVPFPDMVEAVRLRVILTAVSLRLRLPQRWNRRWLSSRPDRAEPTPGPETRNKIERFVRLTRIVASPRFARGMTCLRRSLALRCRLSRFGVRAGLVYGARKVEGRTQAHAWLEVGALKIDSYGTDSSFSPFQRP